MLPIRNKYVSFVAIWVIFQNSITIAYLAIIALKHIMITNLSNSVENQMAASATLATHWNF